MQIFRNKPKWMDLNLFPEHAEDPSWTNINSNLKHISSNEKKRQNIMHGKQEAIKESYSSGKSFTRQKMYISKRYGLGNIFLYLFHRKTGVSKFLDQMNVLKPSYGPLKFK